MKEYEVQLSQELFQIKIEIENEFRKGNKVNSEFYSLINKAIDFLKSSRRGESISKKLPIFRYFENKYGINNLYLIKLSREARALYTYVSQEKFKILQIILEIYNSHKEYEKVGGYN